MRMSATQHKEDTNYDERDTEQLSHVESHPSLEIHLLLLDEFHKETEGEDEGNAESEVEACSYGSPAVASLALIVINTYSYYKYNKVSQRLVELGRMSWRCHTIDQRFTCMEDKSPRHVSGHSYNLGIQEVADADATGSERSGYAHVVDHRHQFHSSAPRIEQHGDEAPECPTVTCQSGITAEVPTATLVPKAQMLLNAIGINFLDSLQSKGMALHLPVVTSVMRTDEDIRGLQRGNANSVTNSCHSYGTTIDITYNRFIPVGGGEPTRYDEGLKKVLAEVLFDLRAMGRCYVKYEKRQACFHLTVI